MIAIAAFNVGMTILAGEICYLLKEKRIRKPVNLAEKQAFPLGGIRSESACFIVAEDMLYRFETVMVWKRLLRERVAG